MNPTIYITRTLDAHDTEALREKLRDLWPGERFTIIHGQCLTPRELFEMHTGPSEYKNTTMTPLPRFDD